MTRTGGHLWWRRYTPPVDVVEWMDVLRPGTPGEVLNDGIIELSSPWLRAVDDGLWPVDARVFPNHLASDTGEVHLRLEFLDGVERDAAWHQFGWGDR